MTGKLCFNEPILRFAGALKPCVGHRVINADGILCALVKINRLHKLALAVAEGNRFKLLQAKAAGDIAQSICLVVVLAENLDSAVSLNCSCGNSEGGISVGNYVVLEGDILIGGVIKADIVGIRALIADLADDYIGVFVFRN